MDAKGHGRGDVVTRLAVVADVHADDYGSKVDPETGLNARWVDSLAMLAWVAKDARERGADALIVAGDLTEARHPAPWRVAMISDALGQFGGPTLLLRGNHDGERAGHSIVDLIANGHGFNRPGVTAVGDTAIAMLPYLDAHRLRALPEYSSIAPAEAFRILGDAFVGIAAGLYVEAQKLGSSTVLVVHQGLSGGLMSDTQAAFLGDQSLVVDTRALGAIGFDAIVAGHFHKHQVLSTNPLIAYAGSPYRTDFGEEHQAKGYLIVDVGQDELPDRTPITDVHLSFVETPARRFVTIHGEDRDNLEDLEDVVAGAVVRVVDLDPAADVAGVRAYLEACGAFEVQEIRRRPVARPTIAGGLSEGLTPQQALASYFEGDADAEALVERGRGILEAVA